ncbi:unnamed protein product [Parnassius mnemosyne]|uniref:Uncharacterized protein n=1 Tax=Parnassius mnemosyne TaxID=213953 RepID=A0AAV1K8C8_9NEOP
MLVKFEFIVSQLLHLIENGKKRLIEWEIENALSEYIAIPSDDNIYAGGDGSDIEDEVITEGQSTTMVEIFLGEDFQGTDLRNSEFDSGDDTLLARLSFSQPLVPPSSPEIQTRIIYCSG